MFRLRYVWWIALVIALFMPTLLPSTVSASGYHQILDQLDLLEAAVLRLPFLASEDDALIEAAAGHSFGGQMTGLLL